MAQDGFGKTATGQAVQAVTLTAGALTARLLTLGSALQDLRLDGVAHGLTLGHARVADYEDPAGAWFGTLVGPVANRIGGATAPCGGRQLRFAPNAGDLLLHSGATGLHAQLFTVAQASADSVTLTLDLPDGTGGFPGNRRITAQWSVAPPATLRLDVSATTDAPTLMNIANHSYWNLDGTPTWEGHRLQIAADRWLPLNADGVPNGTIDALPDTLDFRRDRTIFPGDPPLDWNFCLADARRDLVPVARLTGRNGLQMEMATTEPGLQVYDGRAAVRPGRYPYEGLAIEAQGWPDAPNQPGFPGIGLLPGETYRQITEWRFSRR